MKIYTLTQHYSYVSEGNTQVFLDKEESLKHFNEEVKNWQDEIATFESTMDEEDFKEEINPEEFLNGEQAKSISFYDGEKYCLLIWEEHDTESKDYKWSQEKVEQ